MNEVTDEAIEEGRVALIQLEQELKEKVNDAVSVGSNKHHSTTGDERRLLDQMPRGARLNNRLESLGLTVEVRNLRSCCGLSNLYIVAGIG